MLSDFTMQFFSTYLCTQPIRKEKLNFIKSLPIGQKLNIIISKDKTHTFIVIVCFIILNYTPLQHAYNWYCSSDYKQIKKKVIELIWLLFFLYFFFFLFFIFHTSLFFERPAILKTNRMISFNILQVKRLIVTVCDISWETKGTKICLMYWKT